MSNKALAELLFPNIKHTPQQYLNDIYPRRNLPEGAVVTRFAPSPTGFLHIGGVFTSLVAERSAHQSGGVVYLRIEDTDKKREHEDGVSAIIKGLSDFGIDFDEGATGPDTEKGAYGPYTQSKRGEIYHAFCKDMVERGIAYPCFCTEEELAAVREEQEENKVLPGYHTEYAHCRNLTFEQVNENIKAGKPYVLRLRSCGKIGGRVKLRDIIRGEIEMDENIADVVLLKQDGIPTYHFAHVVDDTVMGTTVVIRGEEWVPSANIHLQLFYMMGLKAPKFAHVSPVMKEENGGKRKLSKRKDPEAAVSYFVEQGYPKEAVIEYLITLQNSNFEDWRKQNKAAPCTEFKFSIGKMSQSGCLFDLVKLQSVSADVISKMTAEQVYEQVRVWSADYDKELCELITRDEEFGKGIFAIDRGGNKPRKDIARWSDVREYASYFFDELRERQWEPVENVEGSDQRAVLESYLKVFSASDDRDTWFAKVKDICAPLGFSPDVKAYKAEPESFKGHVGDISSVIRVALTGRKNTPDLSSIVTLLGQDKCEKRIKEYILELK